MSFRGNGLVVWSLEGYWGFGLMLFKGFNIFIDVSITFLLPHVHLDVVVFGREDMEDLEDTHSVESDA